MNWNYSIEVALDIIGNEADGQKGKKKRGGGGDGVSFAINSHKQSPTKLRQ